jgi:hypothetical protein
VYLQLQPDREPISENPFGQVFRAHHAVDWRKEHGGAAPIQRVPRHDVAREFIVRAILDYELHLIARSKTIDVAPLDVSGFAARRTFHVEHFDNASRDAAHINVAAGFE